MKGSCGTSTNIQYSPKRQKQIQRAVDRKSRQPAGICEWTKYDKFGNIIDQGTYWDDGVFKRNKFKKKKGYKKNEDWSKRKKLWKERYWNKKWGSI